MQITSKLIEIETKFPVDNEVIEQKMLDMGIKPLRWAIVGCGSRVWRLEGRALLACRAATGRWRRKRLHCKRNRSLNNRNILSVSVACEVCDMILEGKSEKEKVKK